MLKLLFGAAFAGLMISGTALGADVAAPAPAFDWSGPYVGIQGGFATGPANQYIPNYAQPNPIGGVSGGLFGGFAGVRKQMNNFVFGAEIGANWRSVDGNNLSGNAGGTEHLDTKQNWDVSLVAKVGVPVNNNILLYALGGADLTAFNMQYSGPFTRTPDLSDLGWTAGAGIEAAISPNITGRLEYRYTGYGQVSCPLPSTSCGGPTSVTPQEHTVALGLSYKF
jgi:outer membrane immunogenic protein